MDAFHSMADQLARAPEPQAQEQGITKVERMRRELRERGRQTARSLADVAQVASSGIVGALLKNDLKAGRVLYAHGFYSWNFEYNGVARGPTGRLREVLEWHEVADGDFPDADLNVLVRLRNNEEPVWIGYWDDDEWRDVDGQIVDVVRWADFPKGGEA